MNKSWENIWISCIKCMKVKVDVIVNYGKSSKKVNSKVKKAWFENVLIVRNVWIISKNSFKIHKNLHKNENPIKNKNFWKSYNNG